MSGELKLCGVVSCELKLRVASLSPEEHAAILFVACEANICYTCQCYVCPDYMMES